MNNFFSQLSHKTKFLIALLFVGVLSVGIFGFGGEASAQGCGGGGSANDPLSVEFCNPLNPTSVDGVITSVLNALRLAIVGIAMIFLVIAGILYITSAGNDSRMTAAKGAFLAALIGLAIAIAAPSFLLEIYEALEATPDVKPPEGGIALSKIVLNILNFLLGIVGTLAIIAFVIGGIMMLTSSGNETRIDGAKKTITWAIVGIAVAIGSLLIVRLIASLFT